MTKKLSMEVDFSTNPLILLTSKAGSGEARELIRLVGRFCNLAEDEKDKGK